MSRREVEKVLQRISLRDLQQLAREFNKSIAATRALQIERLLTIQQIGGTRDFNSLPDSVVIDLLVAMPANEIQKLCRTNKRLTRLCETTVWSSKAYQDMPELRTKPDILRVIHDANDYQILYYMPITNWLKSINITTRLNSLFRTPVLWLNNRNLTSIPKEIGRLKNLPKLYGFVVANNNLTSLPKEIGQLTNLRWMNLANNPRLRSLPQEIGQLDIKFFDDGDLYPDLIFQYELARISYNKLSESSSLLLNNDKYRQIIDKRNFSTGEIISLCTNATTLTPLCNNNDFWLYVLENTLVYSFIETPDTDWRLTVNETYYRYARESLRLHEWIKTVKNINEVKRPEWRFRYFEWVRNDHLALSENRQAQQIVLPLPETYDTKIPINQSQLFDLLKFAFDDDTQLLKLMQNLSLIKQKIRRKKMAGYELQRVIRNIIGRTKHEYINYGWTVANIKQAINASQLPITGDQLNNFTKKKDRRYHDHMNKSYYVVIYLLMIDFFSHQFQD